MAEYRLWNFREVEFNGILEQLKSDFVVTVLGKLSLIFGKKVTTSCTFLNREFGFKGFQSSYSLV